jgi:hypothetical protein
MDVGRSEPGAGVGTGLGTGLGKGAFEEFLAVEHPCRANRI